MVAISILICSALLDGSLVSSAAETEEPVFAVDFDGSVVARGAGGAEIQPLKAEGVEFSPGIWGQALRADGCLVTYPADVVPQERGTLVMWLSPLADKPGEELSQWRIYFGDNEQWGPLGMPRLWLFGSILRFDFAEGKWLWASIPESAGWSGGAWHQFVGTWDCSGQLAFYFDGRKLMNRTRLPWQPQPRGAFRIGSGLTFNGAGHLPAHALVDNVRLYDRMWSAEQVQEAYMTAGIPSLSFRLCQRVFDHPPETLPLQVGNTGGGRWQGVVDWTCGECQGTFELDLAPGEKKEVALEGAASPDSVGGVALRLNWHEGIDNILVRTQDLFAYVPAPVGPPPDKGPEWRRLAEVDCAKQSPVSEVGESRVVRGPAGRYREAGANRYDRFAYIFELSAPRRMARLTVKYPDDATRAIIIGSNIPLEDDAVPHGSERQVLSNGLLTGGGYSLSNKMQRRQYVFPAMSKHVAVIIETGVQGQRAAVASLMLEEAEFGWYGPAASPAALQARDHRRMGLYWEDPVFGQDFGWTGTDYLRWDESLKRALDYMAWAGEDLLVYPTVWYEGPIYSSRTEPGTWPYGGRQHPPDYPRLMAIRCAQRDIKFIPTFHIWRLPSLMHLILSAEGVIAGKPSVNTVTREGKVLTSNTWHSPPLLNAQHPEVQAALLRLVDEHVAMCGDQPSFAGIEFALWPNSPMQTGPELLTSYDDWTMGEFARSIGEAPPGELQSAERFKQRADWILNDPQRRERWIRWRCDQMTAFYDEVAAHLAKAGPRAKLRLAIQQPYPWIDTDPAEALLEQGIDLKALSRNPQIVIGRFTNQTFSRIARLTDPAFVPPGGTKLGVITDYDALELTRRFQRPFYGLARTSVIVHQQYYESHAAFRGGRPRLKFPEPWKTEAHGRCSQPAPRGRYFLRHPALGLYLFDAQWLSIGGYNLGTVGFEEEVREFATVFRALPAVPFRDLGCTGPIIVRSAQAEGSLWLYAVNITDREARLSLQVEDGTLQDVATGETLSHAPGQTEFTLRPYELRVWRTSADASVRVRGRVHPPAYTGLR